ncbi:diguanylate cyclase [Desulfonatronospira sp.]|uniref:diguanylate cyclase n=1 Tax=Desulfonatronospira sp. TaxID=1962951 RepID=UPI0025C44415|nr:diguanylate cyclase [Desulfonatronospira sp.]
MDIEKSRILIVDDEKINLKFLADLLQEDYTAMLARDGRKALQLARQTPQPDLILLDVAMPGMTGFEVIKELKHDDETKHIPIIFVTAMDSTEQEEEGLKLGAVDYITKPISPPIVKMRVRNYLDMQHKYKLLEQKANLDGLTEIPNRRFFEEVLGREWQRGKRNGSSLSVAMLDIDFFKQYNDHYGHQKGDIALQTVARNITYSLKRAPDYVGRYGGEEFVILMPETPLKPALIVAERIRSGIEGLKIPHACSSVSLHLTVSIGVSTSNDYTESGPQVLIQRADQNMYKAKQSGRNQVSGG